MVKREKLRVIGARRKREAVEKANVELEACSTINEYNGCISLPRGISMISTNNISPQEFFRDYIATRTPVKFTDHLRDEDWKVNVKHWNHDYLRQHCPETMTLKVEYRDVIANENFGKGQECFMSFHDFLHRIEEGDHSLYLTTQELEYDPEGQPYILTDPLSHLTHDFPLTPALFSTLVISNINLWYGQTKVPTTSGLHHDFHDNLYIMVKGEKEVTLISPAYALQLYTEGKIVKVHPNGRINYEGQITEADGRDMQAEKAWDAAKRLQEAANRLESISTGMDDDAEDEMDRALEAVLDAEMDNFNEDDEDYDDELDEDDEGFQNLADFVESDLGDDEDEEEFMNTKRRRVNEQDDGKTKTLIGKTMTDTGRPKSFSQIDTSLSDKEISSKFPAFSEAKKDMIKVTIKAGEMLFIPAGWFHEVKSQGSKGHIAFNYWFHPPDQPNFNKPYSSDFWKKNFESRRIHKPLSKSVETKIVSKSSKPSKNKK